jgi:transposase-like protein
MEVVWRTLYFYFKFPLSLRQVAELMLDRGVRVSHTAFTVGRCVSDPNSRKSSGSSKPKQDRNPAKPLSQ